MGVIPEIAPGSVDYSMKVFVLTKTENKQSRPFDVVTSEEAAKAWYKESKDNDFYPFVVDEAPASATPQLPKPVFRFPQPPSITGCDAATALHKLSAYMVQLSSAFEAVEAAVNA